MRLIFALRLRGVWWGGMALAVGLILMAAIPSLAVEKSGKKQGQRVEKPDWSVIDDAPYRVIPGHPILKKGGESLGELGFDSVKTLFSNIDKRTAFLSVAFSPDGRFIVSCSNDHTVKLWDVENKRLAHTFKVHSGWFSSVAYSPDGRFIVSGLGNKTVKLWDVENRSLAHTFRGHSTNVTSVAFSPDGGFIVSGSALFRGGDNTVNLWDVENRRLAHTFQGHSSDVNSVAFSPDGRFIVSGSDDKTVNLWDVENRRLAHTFKGHSGSVNSVAFSPDGRFIVSGSWDKTVKLWNMENRRLFHTFQGHLGNIDSVAFSPDGRFIVSGSWDKTVKLWDVENKRLAHTFQGHLSWVRSVAFSPDGRLIVSGAGSSGGDNTIKLWDVENRRLVHTSQGYSDRVKSVAFSSDGRFIASGVGSYVGGDDNTVKLWDVENKRLIHTFQGHLGWVNSVAFSPDGRFIVSGSGSYEGYNTVKLWDVENERLIHTFQGHSDVVTSVAFSPDGGFIVSSAGLSGHDNTIKLWDVKNRRLAHTFEGHSGGVSSVAFSLDGRFIVSGSGYNTVDLWDVENRRLVHTFQGHLGSVTSVAFSLDGGFIVSGSGSNTGRDDTVKLWDVENKRLVHTFQGHSSNVNSVAFSPDGGFIVSGSGSYKGGDNTVKLWDVENKELVHTFQGHSDDVNSVAFSPDGKFIISGSDDGTTKIWDIRSKKESQRLHGGNDGNWLIIDKKDNLKIFRGDDGSFLKRRSPENNGDWRPAFIAGMPGQDHFSLATAPESLSISPGESKQIRIQITNTGSHPIYQLRLKPSMSDDETVRLDPPGNYFDFNGKGEQEWNPMRIAKLEQGETAFLYARVTPNLKLPAHFTTPGARQLSLTVVSANGSEFSTTINVTPQSPNLELQNAKIGEDGKTLKMELFNTGNAPLRKFNLGLYAAKTDKRSNKESSAQKPIAEEISKSRESIENLEAGAKAEIAFILPDNLDLKSHALSLKGRTGDELPIFAWETPISEIEIAPQWPYWLLAPLLLMTLGAIFYLRRYRHPLVTQLSKTPAALLRLPPEQLEDARIRLMQTRRLDKIVSEAGSTQNILSQAIRFFGESTPEEKAETLAKCLGGTVTNQRLGLWELSLPNHFPLNLDRCLLYFPAPESEPEDIFNDLKGIEATRQLPTILIGPDSECQRKLLDKTKDRSNKLVAPSGSDLTHLLMSPEPEIALAKILAGQLTLKHLSPYQLGGGVNRESVFFGRTEIIDHIMNRDLSNYLVVGGRQLGKSSLLKALERRYKEKPGVVCHYLSLSSEVIIPRLASLMGLPKGSGLEEIAQNVAQNVTQKKERFVFLIDEADHFIKHEKGSGYLILNALRRMSEEGHAYFILAGFWELYEHAALDYQSPLKNFGETIRIGALEPEACRQLATLPMGNMRLKYADPGLVETMLELTGRRANLMAIACAEILARLKPDQRVINADDVAASLDGHHIYDRLKSWDIMTDDKHNGRLDRIVVYATIEAEQFNLNELLGILVQNGLRPDLKEIDNSLARLELGFVLGRNEDGTWFYRTPLLSKMIIRDQPATRLKPEIEQYMRHMR